MLDPRLPVSALYGALNLHERSQSLTGAPTPPASERAEFRLKRWQAQFPFSEGPYFAQRLAADGISDAEFRYLVSEPTDVLATRLRQTPAWHKTLTDTITTAKSSRFSWQLQIEAENDIAEFLHVLAPFIHSAHERLASVVPRLKRRHPNSPFDPSTVVSVLLQDLPARLLHLVSRTLALELNVARLEGRLRGTTAKERFHDFVDQLRQPEALESLLREYSVLGRVIAVCVEQWVTCSSEFLERLCLDWSQLSERFFSDAPHGTLTSVQSGAGDTHDGGRSVCIARFSSGLSLVYKPRPLAVERHFQELLGWLNDRGHSPQFRRLTLLDRGEYGWVEYVAPASCETTAEVAEFYQRQGGYLAILHLLHATDFHFENIIAAGPDPMLIDLESLLHPQLSGPEGSESFDRATAAMKDSVLRIGLLPQRLWASDETDGIDLSGLTATDGQLHPSATAVLDLSALDEMRVTRERRALSGGRHRPTRCGEEIDVAAYTDAICEGFAQTYQAFLQHKPALIDPQGPLARFAEDRTRVILRPTRAYGLLLQESHHPDVLRDALDRDQLFDRLWVTVPQQPCLSRVIPAERDDLWRGDIPLFRACANSRDLWCSDGRCIADYFEKSGMQLVRERAESLSDDDLQRQLWFIRASMGTLSDKPHRQTSVTRPARAQPSQESSTGLLSAAGDVAVYLDRLALWGQEKDDVSWLGLTPGGGGRWMLTPLGPDLYSGLAGIALFGAYLGAATDDPHPTSMARAALGAMRRQLTFAGEHLRSIGAFDGWGSAIYVLTHLGAIWDDSSLLDEAESHVGRISQLIEQDRRFDIMGGAAGAAACLLALYRTTGYGPARDAALRCGAWLVANRPYCAAEALTGFSHGAAGMAWALLDLAAVTGERSFHREAVHAIGFERKRFSPAAGNWPDLRSLAEGSGVSETNEPQFMCAWCHGAAGIGLARLRSLPLWDDSQLRSEINVALGTTLLEGFGGNHSLCHGDLGNLELLLEANRFLENGTWTRHCQQLSAAIHNDIRQNGWRCGVPVGAETPGFMTGLAGIGYGLLRAWDPDRIPSVLTLAPPNLEM